MMDERQIEAALRAEPPDEPVYRGNLTARLRAHRTDADEKGRPAHEIEVVELAPRRRPQLPAVAGAVAAAAVLVVALVVVTRPEDRPVATTPTTTSSPTTTPTSSSVTADGVPPDLVGRWVGATPAGVTTPNPSAPAFVVFSEDSVTFEHLSGGIVHDFNSHVSVTGPGSLQLTVADPSVPCGEVGGDYRWTVSPQGTTLTLEVMSDECPDRAAALAGVWTHIACPVRGSDCLGPLEAGHYASVTFDPLDIDSYGEVAYDVTDGWSSTFDDKTRLTLLPPGGDESGVHGLYLFADVATATTDCPATAGTSIGATAITSTLSAMTGLSITSSDATVGGYQAQVLDISADAALACAGGQLLLASRQGASTSWQLSIGENQQMRLVLIDLPHEHTMAVAVASDRSPQEYAELLDAATAVIDSLTLSGTA